MLMILSHLSIVELVLIRWQYARVFVYTIIHIYIILDVITIEKPTKRKSEKKVTEGLEAASVELATTEKAKKNKKTLDIFYLAAIYFSKFSSVSCSITLKHADKNERNIIDRTKERNNNDDGFSMAFTFFYSLFLLPFLQKKKKHIKMLVIFVRSNSNCHSTKTPLISIWTRLRIEGSLSKCIDFFLLSFFRFIWNCICLMSCLLPDIPYAIV